MHAVKLGWGGKKGVLYPLLPQPRSKCKPGTSSCLLGVASGEGLAHLSGRPLEERSLRLKSFQEEEVRVASLAHWSIFCKHSYWDSWKVLPFLLSLDICTMALPVSHGPIGVRALDMAFPRQNTHSFSASSAAYNSLRRHMLFMLGTGDINRSETYFIGGKGKMHRWSQLCVGALILEPYVIKALRDTLSLRGRGSFVLVVGNRAGAWRMWKTVLD